MRCSQGSHRADWQTVHSEDLKASGLFLGTRKGKGGEGSSSESRVYNSVIRPNFVGGLSFTSQPEWTEMEAVQVDIATCSHQLEALI